MIHPSSLAVDYIWQKLREKYLDESTDEPIADMSALSSAVNHRFEGSDSDAHAKFATAQLKRVDELSSKYPYLDLGAARDHFRGVVASSSRAVAKSPAVQKPAELVGVCSRESSDVEYATTRAEVRARNLPHRWYVCV